MLILIDQDGVLADFERGFYDAWNVSGNGHSALPLHERHSFYVREDYPSHLRKEVEAVYSTPGFYRDLPPIDGAIKAVNDLLSMGHDVRICTSPLNNYRYCLPEKYEWVEQHLGPDLVSRMIVTKDKTIVHGDVLVDDKPEVKGSRVPDWLHIIFDQPYNRHLQGTRISWANWRDMLTLSHICSPTSN